MKCLKTDQAQRALALGLGAASLGLFVAILIVADNSSRAAPIPVIPAGYQVAPTNAPETPIALAPITITANALRPSTRNSAPNPQAPETLQAIVEAVATIVGSSAANESEPTNLHADWATWARMDGAPILLQNSNAEAVSAYAARRPEGATLCLVNRARQKVPTIAQITLPRGVYKIERLTLSGGSTGIEAAAQEPATEVCPRVRLANLQGEDLAGSARVTKKYTLEPGQACLYRYTNVAQQAQAAYRDLNRSLHQLARSQPDRARKLRGILREAPPYFSGLIAPEDRKARHSRRLNCIHRLLLITAQAQAVQRNNQARGAVPAETGAAVTENLERLTDALADTSATLLGLVPGVVLETKSDALPGEAAAQKSGLQSVQEMPASRATTAVTLSLANTGTQRLGTVKLAIDLAALPRDVACEPAEPAVFDALAPGQTVHAVYRLRSRKGMALPPDLRGAGEFSYFIAGAAARLRARSW